VSAADLVLDASAMVLALTSPSTDAAELRRRCARDVVHAPHLLDAEVGSALRGRALGGHLAEREVPALLADAAALVDHRYPHHGALSATAWDLRHNTSFYDALYVALAASLDAVLVTADAKLAHAPALPCRVHLLDQR